MSITVVERDRMAARLAEIRPFLDERAWRLLHQPTRASHRSRAREDPRRRDQRQHPVWAWGWNGYGELGDGTTTERHTPVQVAGLTGVTAVTAGEEEHSLAIAGP